MWNVNCLSATLSLLYEWLNKVKLNFNNNEDALNNQECTSNTDVVSKQFQVSLHVTKTMLKQQVNQMAPKYNTK